MSRSCGSRQQCGYRATAKAQVQHKGRWRFLQRGSRHSHRPVLHRGVCVWWAHQWEVIHGHKVILCRKSKYFQGAVEFKSAHTFTPATSESQLALSNKRKQRPVKLDTEEPDAAYFSKTVIFDSLAPEQLPVYKDMIKFMYTNQLPEGVQLSEVIALLDLADYVLVDSLKEQCLEHLASVSFLRCSQQDQHLLLSRMDTFVSLARAQPDELCGHAADAVEVSARMHLVQHFEDKFWQDKANRKVWEGLPWGFVRAVLSVGKLAVRSENTVLMAALSWLRGERGMQLKQQASGEAEGQERHRKRKAILEAVRLLRLEPWHLTWLLFDVPEAAELLDGQVLRKISQFKMYAEGGSSRSSLLQDGGAQFRVWARPRGGSLPRPSPASVRWKAADVLAAIKELLAGSNAPVTHSGGTVYCAGFDWQLELRLSRPADGEAAEGMVKLWGGVRPSLGMGGGATGTPDQPHLATWPCRYSFKWGTGDVIRVVNAAASVPKAEFGRQHYIGPGLTAAAQMLQEEQDGDDVMLTVTLSPFK